MLIVLLLLTTHSHVNPGLQQLAAGIVSSWCQPVSCKLSLDHDSFGAMLFRLFLGSFLGLGLEAWSCQALLVAASPCLPFAVPSFASSPHRRHRFAIASSGFWAVYFNPEG